MFTDFSDFLGRLHAADPMTLGHSGSGIIEFQDWEPLGGLPGNPGDDATSLS